MRGAPAPAATDPALIAEVRHALMAEPALRAGRIHILAVRGIVRLSGVLHSGELLEKATQVAGRVPGVSCVRSLVSVRSARRAR